MSPELEKRIAALASNREAGASELLAEAIAILQAALGGGGDVRQVARAICQAQPSMAPMWNAAHAALGGDLERFAQRAERAPAAVARFSAEALQVGLPPGAAVRIATISYSATVLRVLEALAAARPLTVACSESRPALEGRRLAMRLAASGIPVTLFADAAIGHGLDACDAVVVGADAVAPGWFLNKSGTRMLAAAALERGVPVYVLAGREKFVSPDVAERLAVIDAGRAEVWDEAPAGVSVRNPSFERTPLELVAGVITDVGMLGADAVSDLCAAISS